jgi:hypothetical protein
MTGKDVEEIQMRKNIFIAMIAGLCLGLVPATVFAGGPGYSGDVHSIPSGMSSDSVNLTEADNWPVSGPVETGAVPGSMESDRISKDSTHFNPFYPELRVIDLGGGGE